MSNARRFIGLIVVAMMAASAASSADQCVDEHIVKYVAETPEWLSRLQVELATPKPWRRRSLITRASSLRHTAPLGFSSTRQT